MSYETSMASQAEEAFWDVNVTVAKAGLEFPGMGVSYWAPGGPRLDLGSIDVRTAARLVSLLRDGLKARTAWLDDLSEDEAAEMLHGLTECMDAIRTAGSDVPERPGGAS